MRRGAGKLQRFNKNLIEIIFQTRYNNIMVFYDFSKLKKLADEREELYVPILKNYFFGLKKPINMSIKFISPKLHGDSYLLDPKSLLYCKQVTAKEIAQYLELSSKRDYSRYKLYGKTDLNLGNYPDLELEAFKFNRLMNITENSIEFIFDRN